jgi:hypothetical protein
MLLQVLWMALTPDLLVLQLFWLHSLLACYPLLQMLPALLQLLLLLLLSSL